jgi:sugar O-acyltransferase (sialic acid O-acetyltransferase NeuD family)
MADTHEINAELSPARGLTAPALPPKQSLNRGGGRMKPFFGLVGAGGFGRGVMPLVRQALDAETDCCFVEKSDSGALVNGTQCMSEDQFFAREEDKFYNIAIANSDVREAIAKKFISRGAYPKQISCSSVKIFDDVEIGDGAILCSYTMITSNIRIGSFFHANIYSYVEHDCVIGNFVTFAPGVQCNGNVVIGDHCYIGAGARWARGKTAGHRRKSGHRHGSSGC